MISLRLATTADLPRIAGLIPLSARGLSAGFYSDEEIESAVRFVFGPDTRLIEDGTYWLAEDDGTLVGCGGWSRRATLYGGDQMKSVDDPLLDPARDAARIRAFFIHPGHGRRGIASMILRACVDAAAEAGFHHLELMATLPGVPFYLRHGFEELEAVRTRLPDGVDVRFVRMRRGIVNSEG